MPLILLIILVVVCAVVIGVVVGMVFLVRRPRTRIPILILTVVIGVAVRIWWVESVQPKFIMINRVEMYRSAYLDFWQYEQEHGGAYPTDLTVFANAPIVVQPSGGSEYTRPDWKSFYYVSGLTTNDPPGMPLMIYVPEDRRVKKGMIGFLGGGSMWYLPETIQRAIREPWEVEGYGKPIDEQTKAQLRQRVRVLPPIKLTEAMRITP